MKHIIDIDTWERRDNYNFFRTFHNSWISITSEVECGEALAAAKASGRSFFLYYLYAILRAANEVKEFRFRTDKNGQVVYHDQVAKALHPAEAGESAPTTAPSQLRQWPVQIKLVPVNAPYFDGARLLIAADCTAYAYAAFHERFIRGHITLVGCPKLDDVDYSEKLTAIIRSNDIQEVTVVRMEVPCCGGLENAAKRALQASGKFIPWQVVTISTDGRILD